MKRYAIKDVFDTLQGEGARAGERSVFVRFAGCNLWDGIPEHRDRGAGACAAWCDTDFAKGTLTTSDELLVRMDALWSGGDLRWCVLTGGEPLLQLDGDLINALCTAGWMVAVETNGTQVLPHPGADWVCVSPKKSNVPLAVKHADEVKVILPGDGRGHHGWSDADLVELQEKIDAEHYFVQPQDPIMPGLVGATHLTGGPQQAKRYDENLRRCIDFVRQHPRWRLGAQLHKLWHLP